MMALTPKFLLNSRLLTSLLLGFCSGLPLALSGSALQAWFTDAQINLMAIGAVTLLGVPYTFKFLWAPLMDYYRPPFLGLRRGWIFITQILLVLAILILANLNPSTQTIEMCIAALLVAFFAASQDVAIDAYKTNLLLPEERGLGSAYYVFTYRIAALLTGGLSFVIADYIGWRLTYEFVALLMLIVSVIMWFTPKIPELPVRINLISTIKTALLDLLRREKIILLLLFIMFYKIGDALALSLMTNFLLHGLNFTLSEVGIAYKTVSFLATILGAFVGGIYLSRWSLYYALLMFGIAQAFSNLMFVLLAVVGKQFLLMTLSIFIENFCSGLSTAAFLAFLMTICNRQYTAGQYALLSAIASLGRVFLGPLAALIVKNVGWVQFYIWSFALCFPGLVFLILLKERVWHYARVTAD